MTKVLIVSDNHGHIKNLKKILKSTQYNIAIHLGDGEVDTNWLRKNFNYFVCGNHEFWEPLELIVKIEGLKVLLTHGHTRGISVFRTEKTVTKILDKTNVDLLLYGHTHIFSYGQHNNKYWLCPGSTNLSRGPEGNGYVLLEIEDKDIIKVEFKKV